MTSTVDCDYTAAGWEVNSLNQNACQVYAALQGICDPSFTIGSVVATSRPYLPPDNPCGCNVVAYNLMAGCAWCQSQILTGWWLTEAQWAGNCTGTTFDTDGIAASVSITGITLPAWATVIPIGTTWDPSQAQAAVASSTTLPSITTPSLTLPFTTTSESSSFPPYPIYTTGGNGPVAGIVVGVVFGLYALLLIGVVVVHFVRQKKRQAWYGPTALYYAGMRNGGVTQALVYQPERPYEAAETPMLTGSSSAGYTNYQPPPPEHPNVAYDYSPDKTSMYGVPNTNSMYGAPRTNSMYGAPPAGSPPGSATAR